MKNSGVAYRGKLECGKKDFRLWPGEGEKHKMWDFSEKYRNFGEKIKKVVDRGKIHPL